MGFTSAELDDFQQFARSQLKKGAVDITLEECLRRWRSSDAELEASVAAIRESIADEEAGRVRPLSVIADEMRRERGYSQGTSFTKVTSDAAKDGPDSIQGGRAKTAYGGST